MDDDELATILRRGDSPVPLPEDLAASIRAEMHAELDRTLDPDANVVVLRQAPRPASTRPRRWTWIAASLLIASGATAVFLVVRNTPDVTDPVSTPPAPTAVQPPTDPPDEFLLVTCRDFIESTQFDGRSWREHFAPNDGDTTPSSDDFVRLADAIETLLDTAPDVAPAASPLRSAMSEARSDEPDPATVVRQLDLAQDVLIREFLLPCLTQNAES